MITRRKWNIAEVIVYEKKWSAEAMNSIASARLKMLYFQIVFKHFQQTYTSDESTARRECRGEHEQLPAIFDTEGREVGQDRTDILEKRTKVQQV